MSDERAAGRTFNVASLDTPTEAEWIALIANACGWPGEIISLPPEQLPESLRSRLQVDQDLVVATERLRELGYTEPVRLDQALSRSIEWERAQESGDPSPDYSAEDRVLTSRGM